jgi:LuxR family quorum-sensing system transcriptional regulator SolR
MERVCQDAHQQFHAAANEHQLFEHIAAFAKQLGFDYCCYGIRIPSPLARPAVSIFDTYPVGWMKHYQENRFIDIDPTVRAGMHSSSLIVWPNKSSGETSRLWSDAHDFGLTVGVAHSSWSANGVFGLLTMSRNAEALTPAEISHLPLPANWLANVSHMMMSRFILAQVTPEAAASLTAREREVLCWTSEGKTSYEIGRIPNIAERTVNFHINNVLLKLNSTNKVQAVVKAMAMGLLNSDW